MKKDLKNILVPVDFKDSSVKAVKYAYNLAEKLKGELVLLNVIETPGLLADFFSSGDNLVKITHQTKEKLRELINSVIKVDSPIKISSKVVRGNPYQKILKVAEEINARLIILGENHQGSEMEKELGSTVYHVTLRSPIPVLTLKGNIEKMNDLVVVPLDLTKQTRKQLYSALAYGLNYGAKIHLVSSLFGGIKIRDSRIYRKLRRAKKILVENGVECHTKLYSRSKIPPFTRVIEYAKEINAGMILVMTHQEGYTFDNYIGAFSHHILNNSEVPVLSLTSSATDWDFTHFLKNIIDPADIYEK